MFPRQAVVCRGKGRVHTTPLHTQQDESFDPRKGKRSGVKAIGTYCSNRCFYSPFFPQTSDREENKERLTQRERERDR